MPENVDGRRNGLHGRKLRVIPDQHLQRTEVLSRRLGLGRSGARRKPQVLSSIVAVGVGLSGKAVLAVFHWCVLCVCIWRRASSARSGMVDIRFVSI